MNALYIYDGPFSTGDAGFPMIRMAAAKYFLELGRAFDYDKSEILRDEKGKPYFVDIPVEFSLTHSGSLWMCLFSDQPCGLDLQEIRDCRWQDIADRHFLPEEQESIREKGMEEFFRIWVRKEAYAKMTGEGFFGADMPSVLENRGQHQGKNFVFQEIEISEDMKCAVASKEDMEIELRILG